MTSKASRPARTPASVVLPEPLGPMMAWTSPALTVRLMPRRISLSSTRACRFLISSMSLTVLYHDQGEVILKLAAAVQASGCCNASINACHAVATQVVDAIPADVLPDAVDMARISQAASARLERDEDGLAGADRRVLRWRGESERRRCRCSTALSPLDAPTIVLPRREADQRRVSRLVVGADGLVGRPRIVPGREAHPSGSCRPRRGRSQASSAAQPPPA